MGLIPDPTTLSAAKLPGSFSSSVAAVCRSSAVIIRSCSSAWCAVPPAGRRRFVLGRLCRLGFFYGDLGEAGLVECGDEGLQVLRCGLDLPQTDLTVAVVACLGPPLLAGDAENGAYECSGAAALTR